MKYILYVLLMIAMVGCGFEQVDEGYRGIQIRFGKIDGEPLPPGLYFYNPFTSSIFEMEVREKKNEYQTDSFTKDNQSVKISFAVTYYPEQSRISEIYSQFGKRDWEEKIVHPVVIGSIKDAIGQYVADDLISKRQTVRAAAEDEIKTALQNRHIIVTRLDIVHLDFEHNFKSAVEAKIVAIQKALEAKNKTVEIEEQAKQSILSAKAEAESMRIRSQALSQNKALVEYEAVQKWNGALPQIILGNGSTPFIDLRSIQKKQ